MQHEPPDRDRLLANAGCGDRSALGRLLEQYRGQLKRVVAQQIDPKIAARLDPSDIVQEAFIDAERRLPEFLKGRPVGFYSWLKGFAVQRLIEGHRIHRRSSKRSVSREIDEGPNASRQLVESLWASGTSPSEAAIRVEERARIQATIQKLSPSDREILVLRYIEGFPFEEISSRVKASVGALKVRHLRAVERLRALIAEQK